MKRLIALGTALLFASGMAFAGHCPKEMKVIDDALGKNPKLSDKEMQDVKKARADGEKLHKEGKHKEALAELTKAQKILKVEPAVK
jgi:hypothetical protein